MKIAPSFLLLLVSCRAGVAEIKTPNEMALKANERKNKEGICRRIFVEHFISLAETERVGGEGGMLSSPHYTFTSPQVCGDIYN